MIPDGSARQVIADGGLFALLMKGHVRHASCLRSEEIDAPGQNESILGMIERMKNARLRCWRRADNTQSGGRAGNATLRKHLGLVAGGPTANSTAQNQRVARSIPNCFRFFSGLLDSLFEAQNHSLFEEV